jgi:putative flippase GtrA
MNPELLRIAIFAVIGVWNTLFDLTIFLTLLNTLGKLPFWKTSKLKAATAFHIVSFLTSNLVSYFLNSRFTFTGGQNRGFLPYFLVTLFALGLSTTFIQYFNKPQFSSWFERTMLPFLKSIPIVKNLKVNEKSWSIILKLASVAISMIVNYLGYKNLVFIGIS